MNISVLKKHENDLLFLPIGGVGEIGINCYLYHYQGKWIIVDLGIGFSMSNPNLPGIEIILPDISFIKKIKDNILAMVITHSHEDHCGAIHHLWGEIRCPVYADAFTIEFIRNKCSYSNIRDEISLNVLGERLIIGGFDMEFVHMTHSTPFMNAIVFRTKHGNFLHTGDWKIDENPIVGQPSNIKKLAEIQRNEGFLGVMSDSTNATLDEKTQSEQSVIEPLKSIFAEATGLITCTMFASNVDRLKIFCNLAKQFNRKIAIFGRSLHNIINISQKFDFFKEITFLEEKDIEGVERQDLLLICTGCQGEELAAMSALVAGKNRFIELELNDTVIFSSKTIPGNDLNVSRLFNMLATKNIHVVHEKTHHVHVSGHPGQQDLKILYDTVKPEFVIPVHGEPVHLREHADFVKKNNISKSVICNNGDIVNLTNDGLPKIIGSIDVGFNCLDGKFDIISPKNENIRERGILAKNGIVFVIIVVNAEMQLLKTPRIMSFGVLNYRIKKNALLLKKMIKNIENLMKKDTTDKIQTLRKKIQNNVANICRKESGKMPIIDVNIDIV